MIIIIKFEDDNIVPSKGSCSTSTLAFGVDVANEPNNCENPKASIHHVLVRTPRDKLVDCDGVWKKQN